MVFVEQLDELGEARPATLSVGRPVHDDDVDLFGSTPSNSLAMAGLSMEPPEKPPSS